MIVKGLNRMARELTRQYRPGVRANRVGGKSSGLTAPYKAKYEPYAFYCHAAQAF